MTETDQREAESLETGSAAVSLDGSGGLRRRRVVEWAGLLLLPVVLLEAYGIPRFYQLSGADPFMYTGYTVSTADLIERFGYPYYAVRFGLILPSNLFAEAFGAVGGYFALRWVVSVIAAAAIFHLLRRLYRWEIGAVAAVMLLLNPMYIRAVMTVYSTVVGVPMVAAATALLLMPGRQRTVYLYRIVAGTMLGLTVNANPFCLLPISAMLVVWALVRATEDKRRAFVELGLIAGAAMAVTVVGSLIYGLRFGDPNIISPSINAARRVSSGVSSDKEVGFHWLNFEPETWLVPISSLLMFGALRFLRRQATWYERAACLMPISMWVAYAIHEFVLGANTLEIYFYMSYMLGPTILAFVMSLALFNERWAGGDRARIVVTLLAVIAAPFAWKQFTPHLSVWSLNGVLPIVVVGTVLLALSIRWRPLPMVLAVFVCLLPLVLSIGRPRDVPLARNQVQRQDPRYFDVYGNERDDSTIDLYALAADFASAVPRTASTPGGVAFWFPNDDPLALLMQWTYLGPISSLNADSTVRMPLLDEKEVRLLSQRTPRYVVVLSSLEDDLTRAESALTDVGLSSVSSRRLYFQRGPYQIFVSVNEFTPSSCDLSEQGEPVPWYTLEPCSAD